MPFELCAIGLPSPWAAAKQKQPVPAQHRVTWPFGAPGFGVSAPLRPRVPGPISETPQTLGALCLHPTDHLARPGPWMRWTRWGLGPQRLPVQVEGEKARGRVARFG